VNVDDQNPYEATALSVSQSFGKSFGLHRSVAIAGLICSCVPASILIVAIAAFELGAPSPSEGVRALTNYTYAAFCVLGIVLGLVALCSRRRAIGNVSILLGVFELFVLWVLHVNI